MDAAGPSSQARGRLRCHYRAEESMEHRTLEEIKRVADVSARDLARRTMSRRERLERWATVLENQGHGSLNALRRIEFLPEDERMLVRADNSPLSLAAQDPILAAEGLASDRLG